MSGKSAELKPDLTERRAREWLKILAKYREPNHTRSFFELAVSVIPFLGFWVAACWALGVSYLLSFAFSICAAAFLVRLFLILHDCSHGAFFKTKALNDWTGRVLGVMTMTPYDVWRRSHSIHHASSGNLDRRGVGDVITLTVNEYKARGFMGRLGYRLYRHPLTLFLLGPIYVFLIRFRLPDDLKTKSLRQWVSAMGTNAAIATIVFTIIFFFGVVPFLMVYLPVTIMAGAAGIWLFYVQHQFEDTHWDKDEDWEMPDAALYGSSYYVLPGFLRWMTANIGIHHVHHLYARIPFYRLSKVLKEHPSLAQIKRLTLWESFKCVKLQLWDENSRRLVSYAEARRVYAAV